MSVAVPVPRATYRLQLNRDFTFAHVEAIAPYLADLGISHAYLSPILKARPGSTHGYDVVDHRLINPELGTREDFRRMAGILKAHGIGILLDIVPNHMGIGGEDNDLWLDVLEWGRLSRFAEWFDINWSPSEPTLRDKVLVPFLSVPYREALEIGKLELRFDAAAGSFAVWAEGAHKLPVCPRDYPGLLGGITPLTNVTAGFAAPDAAGAGAELKEKLAHACAGDPAVATAIGQAVARVNREDGRDALDALISRQNWRPARYSVAADDINYRRFFVVSDLAAIRVERPEVFEHIHRLTFDLIAEGLVDGLRIDHIDGLFDPKAYCLKLREASPRPVYILVEKILAPWEKLRADWNVEGTSGYEFATAVNQLLTDPAGETILSQAYAGMSGRTETLDAVERQAKLNIADYEMAAELDALTAKLREIAAGGRRSADITRNAIRNGLRHVIAGMSAYRTYVDGGPLSAIDGRTICHAIAHARRLAPAMDPAVFDFLAQVMSGEPAGDDRVLEAARRIQQYTGPVMAKGLEDTALYRYNRLISLSDVGSRPDRFSRSVASFHDINAARLAELPHTMLGTSTHDTKRGEDVRARVGALSGRPEEWAIAVARWHELLQAQGAPRIDPNESYYFFQLLLGAWPASLPEIGPLPGTELQSFRTRLHGAMLKSVREARLRTNWNVPGSTYERAVAELVDTALSDGPFLADFRRVQAEVARDGARSSLVATALKLTVPGMPDIYQGAELWEESMVDPDNRRPVDYTLLRHLLESLDVHTDITLLAADWRSGAVKQALIARILRFRARHPRLFAQGSYRPLAVSGPDARRVVAFSREGDGQHVTVCAVLHPWRGRADFSLDGSSLPGSTIHELLRARSVSVGKELPELLAELPVAVFTGS